MDFIKAVEVMEQGKACRQTSWVRDNPDLVISDFVLSWNYSDGPVPAKITYMMVEGEDWIETED